MLVAERRSMMCSQGDSRDAIKKMSEEDKNKTRDDISDALKVLFGGSTGKWKIRGTQTVLRYFVCGEPYGGATVWTLLCIFAGSGQSVFEFKVGEGSVRIAIDRRSTQATAESTGEASS